MSKLAIVSGHVKTASFPNGFCVVPGTILADAHEAVVAMPSWFTTVTGSKQATHYGMRQDRELPGRLLVRPGSDPGLGA